jgi:Xaa-Pro aminopeptidase
MDRITVLRHRLADSGRQAFISLAPPVNQYLCGFRGTTSAIVLTANEAQFLCDFRYIEQAGEQVSGMAIEEMKGSLPMRVGERLTALGVHSAAFDPAYMTVAELQALQSGFSGELRPVADVVSPLRSVKDPGEIEKVRAAQQFAEGVLSDLLEELTPGLAERELAARFEYEFKRRGASGASFDTIVLFGARSSLPHGQPSGAVLAVGDTVLLDFGCRLDGYCSDLTRTYAFGRMPGSWFEEVYGLTLAAQRKALEAVRPGLRGREIDAVARTVIESGGHGRRFGHGLGHGVGIEIHEPPRLNSESETVLEPGMIVTIEPGIYLPGLGGVRIEDLVVVTETGCENLTSAPKELRVLGI